MNGPSRGLSRWGFIRSRWFCSRSWPVVSSASSAQRRVQKWLQEIPIHDLGTGEMGSQKPSEIGTLVLYINIEIHAQIIYIYIIYIGYTSWIFKLCFVFRPQEVLQHLKNIWLRTFIVFTMEFWFHSFLLPPSRQGNHGDITNQWCFDSSRAPSRMMRLSWCSRKMGEFICSRRPAAEAVYMLRWVWVMSQNDWSTKNGCFQIPQRSMFWWFHWYSS